MTTHSLAPHTIRNSFRIQRLNITPLESILTKKGKGLPGAFQYQFVSQANNCSR